MAENFLKAFFNLFDGQITIHENVGNEKFDGVVHWDDGGEQQFRCQLQTNKDFEKLTDLCNFLKGENLVKSDNVSVGEEILIEKLAESGWDRTTAIKSIDDLLSIEIKMIDDGEETDSFYLHF